MALKSGLREMLKPLEVKCTNTDCDNELHCFMQTKKMKAANKGERCRSCGIDLVDWSRIRMCDPVDTDYTFTALKKEFIRHYFWHVPIDQKAINHARRKGRVGMEAAAEQRLRKSVGQAVNSYEGRQTPKSGNILYYAQHAVAACCRKCMEQWHGIPLGRALTDSEIGYLKELVMRFVDERMPLLTSQGEKVPSIRKKKEKRSDDEGSPQGKCQQ